jgi:hypothetical protein
LPAVIFGFTLRTMTSPSRLPCRVAVKPLSVFP